LAPEVLDALESLVSEQVAAAIASRPDPMAARWLTLDRAGELLGCSRDAVRMRANRGRLEMRRHGRRIYVSAASVAELARVPYNASH
jgi:DNA-directed RNA polymerase specialized sigma24 family protein